MGARKNGAREEDTQGERFSWASQECAPSPLACSFLHITCKRLLRRITSLPKPRQHKKPRRKSRTKLFSSYWRFSNPLSINLIILVFHVTLFPRIALQSLDLLWQGLTLPWENSWHFTTPPLTSREMTSEKRAKKFHTDDASLPRSG